MKEPSDKQVSCANYINRMLNIPLPIEYSSKAYWEYISKNLKYAQDASAVAKMEAEWDREEQNRERRLKREQRDVDWRAANGWSGVTYDDHILTGGIKPSWISGSDEDYRRYLRSLGCKTIEEIHTQIENDLAHFTRYD